MRPRTPTFIWIPFVFSVGGVSWALLIASVGIMAAVILAPAVQDVRDAEIHRNDVQATVDLLDQKLGLQEEFIQVAGKDPLVLERLASRQLGYKRPDQEILNLDPAARHKDQSVTSLLAASLKPVTPHPVADVPWYLAPALKPALRPLLILLACVGMALGYLLGVRLERPVRTVSSTIGSVPSNVPPASGAPSAAAQH